VGTGRREGSQQAREAAAGVMPRQACGRGRAGRRGQPARREAGRKAANVPLGFAPARPGCRWRRAAVPQPREPPRAPRARACRTSAPSSWPREAGQGPRGALASLSGGPCHGRRAPAGHTGAQGVASAQRAARGGRGRRRDAGAKRQMAHGSWRTRLASSTSPQARAPTAAPRSGALARAGGLQQRWEGARRDLADSARQKRDAPRSVRLLHVTRCASAAGALLSRAPRAPCPRRRRCSPEPRVSPRRVPLRFRAACAAARRSLAAPRRGATGVASRKKATAGRPALCRTWLASCRARWAASSRRSRAARRAGLHLLQKQPVRHAVLVPRALRRPRLTLRRLFALCRAEALRALGDTLREGLAQATAGVAPPAGAPAVALRRRRCNTRRN
jgi:hypothetical protein